MKTARDGAPNTGPGPSQPPEQGAIGYGYNATSPTTGQGGSDVSPRGYIAIDRGVFDHPAFANETFTEREAWVWLIAEAAWKQTQVRVGKAIFTVERGCLVHSLRYLGARWRWSHTRVRRFLKVIETEGMIVTRTFRDATHITLCNYDEYQSPRNTDETETITQAQRGRNRKEPYNQSTSKEDISLARPERQKPSKAAQPDRFSEFWDAYPKRVGKGGAEKAFAKAVRVTEADVIISGARRFAERRAGQDPQFTPHPATWLNGKRWEDDPAADTPPKQDDRHEQSPKPRGYAPAHSSSSNILAAAAGELRKRTDPGGWGRVLHDEPDDDGGETLDLVASGGSWGAR